MSQQEESPRLSLGARILIGLGLGIALGLFVGELAAPLRFVGDAFVGLLQMTVLPYIIVTLIANVGRLSIDRGKVLLSRAILVWGGILLVGACVIVAMARAFPNRAVPSFFSASTTEAPQTLDLLKLFVPINVFESLVTNAVPGVVLFCICVGVALTAISNKRGLIEGLDGLGDAIARVNGFVVRLTPYGVFAIAAAAAGTMTVEEFGRLRGYLLVLVLASLILSFVVLPGIIAACTPFRYREILQRSSDALLTAFATGKVLVVLPMLIENTKAMFAENEHRDPEIEPCVDVLYPLIYPFPYLGKLLALLFIPFAAAFVGRSMELSEYLPLLGMGTLSLFGGPIITIPFLLEANELPADMFQLFVLSGVVTSRFGDLVGVVNLFAFSVITTCILVGRFRVRWHALGSVLALSALLVGVASGASRAWLESSKDDFRRDVVIGSMHLPEGGRVAESVIFEERTANPAPLGDPASRLDRIRERGVLRVGFNDDNLPYVFRNAGGDLVGLDVEMVHGLALDLGVTLELVPFDRSTLADQLQKDHFDIAIGGLIGTVARSERMRLVGPYLEATFGLVVRDYRARDLDTYAEIIRVDSLRVGLLTESQFSSALRRHLPQTETVIVPSAAWFFETEHDLDALLISAEAGAAFSMLNPDYQVVVPTRRRVTMPLVYATPPDDESFSEFIDYWISVQQSTGRVAELADYWLRGEGTTPLRPRWSIARDVLQWID
jgi:Na+/H+-dicarboxylate symporter/ABC-type amino acid transport substrate-binding protein